MLRELQVTKDKPANSMYKSSEELVVTGMAVVKNESTKTFEFASAEAVADLFFVDKERVPHGVNAVKTNVSDYDVDFTNVAEDEFAKLIAYYPGERFATDQFESAVESATVGSRLSAGTNGKLKISTLASKYVFKGIYTDNGHKLAIVEVSDTASV